MKHYNFKVWKKEEMENMIAGAGSFFVSLIAGDSFSSIVSPTENIKKALAKKELNELLDEYHRWFIREHDSEISSCNDDMNLFVSKRKEMLDSFEKYYLNSRPDIRTNREEQFLEEAYRIVSPLEPVSEIGQKYLSDFFQIVLTKKTGVLSSEIQAIINYISDQINEEIRKQNIRISQAEGKIEVNNLDNEKLDKILETINAGKRDDPELFGRLMERFINQRSNHPSIRMMTPDARLFPRGIPAITSSDRTAFVGDQGPYSIKEMIIKSWEEPEIKHILLVGKGGIGKTVAMLTIPIEEWIRPYNIPALYVPLNRLENYAGNLNEYISKNYINDIDGIYERANSCWAEHPNLLLLLDGFNEIPMEFRRTAESHISEWMEKPGVQIITTSRISFFMDSDFTEYILQPLNDEAVRKYLISSGVDQNELPSKSDDIWKVINVPLMMVIYLRTDKVKERTYRGSGYKYLEWKDSDNAAHIIWNYLQVELYKHISVLKTKSAIPVASILAVAPYICFEMAKNGKFRVEQKEFESLICKALVFFNENQTAIHGQIENVKKFIHRFREDLFLADSWETHLSVLTDQSVFFQAIEEKNDYNGKYEIYYVSAHQIFRDALAAIFISTFLLNICKPDYRKGTPEKIFDAADYYVKKYISEFLSDDELINIWNHHRKYEPGNGRITWILMDIIGRKRNYDYSELDFSELDLTTTNLHRLLSRRLDICPLPKDGTLLNMTRITMNSFLPEGHTQDITSVAYSPDGRQIASGALDGTVRIWNLESGENRKLHSNAMSIYSIAYSPDGSKLASGSSSGIICIWDLESGESYILRGHKENVKSVAYSPDGRQLASGSDDKSIRIWDLESGESRILEGHRWRVESVAYSPDGKQIASGSGDNTIHIWDLVNGKSRTLEGHTSFVYSISYSPDGRQIASGSGDNTIRIWDLVNGESRIFKGHTDTVTSVVYSPDGSWLVSGSDDRTIRIWNFESGENRVLKDYENSVTTISCSPDGRQLAGGLRGSALRIFDLESKERLVLEGNTGIVNSMAYSLDGRQLAIGLGDRTLRIINLDSGESRVLEGRADVITSIAYSPDKRHLSCGSNIGTIRIWDLKSGESRVLEGHTRSVTSIAYKPDGRHLVSGSIDGTFRIWDLEGGESSILEDYNTLVFNKAYSPDGRYLASIFGDRTLRIVNLESRKSRILEDYSMLITNIAFSPDGRYLARTSMNGTIRIWDLESEENKVLDGLAWETYCIAYSPDGRYLASASRYGDSIQIWDLESGESYDLKVRKGQVNTIIYSPIGEYLASGLMDGTVQIWDVVKRCVIRCYRIIPGINLNKLNCEYATIPDEEKELFRECGIKVK